MTRALLGLALLAALTLLVRGQDCDSCKRGTAVLNELLYQDKQWGFYVLGKNLVQMQMHLLECQQKTPNNCLQIENVIKGITNGDKHGNVVNWDLFCQSACMG